MVFNNKPLNQITENDLQALIENEVAEVKTLDYKEILPSRDDSGKKEFLYDISSFANASGGYLIFGIKEDKGLPIDVKGLDITDLDAETLRLENVIRDSIEPRIPGINIQSIHLNNKKYVIIIHIPRSFAMPHMIKFKHDGKFYSRNSSAGKYQLDVGEIRTAFTLSQNLTDRIRDFRRERLSTIISDETPVFLESKAKLVLHLIPINAFEPRSIIEISEITNIYNNQTSRDFFAPLFSGGWKRKYNLDGYLTYFSLSLSKADSYLQIFRNGIIEATSTLAMGFSENKGNYFIDKDYEKEVIEGLSKFLKIQKNLRQETPIFVFLSMLGVKDYIMEYERDFRRSLGHPIDRDNLIIPEVLIEDYECDLSQVMKPIFNAVWNAAGYPHSLNYDEVGNWKEQGTVRR